MYKDLETTYIEKVKKRSDKSVSHCNFLAKNGLINQLANILLTLIRDMKRGR